MTLFFNNNQITIYRQRRIGSSFRSAFSATFTAFDADIQPVTPQRQQLEDGRFGALFTAFVETSSQIKEGDQLVVIETGKRYSVKGVQTWEGAGLLDHLELLLAAQDG